MLRVQKNYIELEMRKFRRKKMVLLHDLENQLLRDVSCWLVLVEQTAVTFSNCRN